MHKQPHADTLYGELDDLEPWAQEELKRIEKQFATRRSAELARANRASSADESRGLIGFLCGLFCGLALSAVIFLFWAPRLH